MGWSFRKSLNLGGGFRLNLSQRGLGLSGGVRGLRVGVGPRGKRLQLTLPGTGVSYRKEEGWKSALAAEGSRPRPLAALLVAAAFAAAALVVALLR